MFWKVRIKMKAMLGKPWETVCVTGSYDFMKFSAI